MTSIRFVGERSRTALSLLGFITSAEDATEAAQWFDYGKANFS